MRQVERIAETDKFLTSSDDGTVKLWQLNHPERKRLNVNTEVVAPLMSLDEHTGGIRSMKHNSNFIVTYSDVDN